MKHVTLSVIITLCAIGVTASAEEAFSPADVAGLELWLDASDASSVIVTNGRVSEWKDKTTNRFDAVQAANEYRPGYEKNAYGAMPMVRFYALGVMLQTDCVPAYGGNPRTIVAALANVAEAPGNINHVLHYGSPSILEAYGITSRGFSLNEWGNHYWGGGFGTGISSEGDGRFIVAVSYADGVDRFTVNGGAAAEKAVALDTAAGRYGKYGIVLGSRIDPYFGQPPEPGRFDCGEVLAFSRALTGEELRKIEGYLAHKWGMTDILPSDHPYRTQRPGLTETQP